MNEMVERVARAICKAAGDNPDAIGGRRFRNMPTLDHAFERWTEYVPDARSVIDAMREPTEAMLGAPSMLEFDFGRIYGAMIAAALT